LNEIMDERPLYVRWTRGTRTKTNYRVLQGPSSNVESTLPSLILLHTEHLCHWSKVGDARPLPPPPPAPVTTSGWWCQIQRGGSVLSHRGRVRPGRRCGQRDVGKVGAVVVRKVGVDPLGPRLLRRRRDGRPHLCGHSPQLVTASAVEGPPNARWWERRGSRYDARALQLHARGKPASGSNCTKLPLRQTGRRAPPTAFITGAGRV